MRNVGLLALRVAVGVVFVYHGWGKLAAIDQTAGFFASQGFPLAVFFAWLVGLVEFLGGLAVLFGFYLRAAAKSLAVVMLVALLVVHTRAAWGMAELPLVLFGACLALLETGGGDWMVSTKDCACKLCGGANACECGKGGSCGCK